MAYEISSKTITVETLASIARDLKKVSLSPNAAIRIHSARNAINNVVSGGEVVYGVTTGFGAFKDTQISEEETKTLQQNLIVSHAVGVGDPLPTEVVRGVMFLIANYLSKGYSGIALETVETLIEMLNRGVHPVVPEKGSVGSSGDLAPSAHIILVMIGRGLAEYEGEMMDGSKAMERAGITPVVLSAKEGLALINNTATMSSIASLVLYDFDWLLNVADVAAALSLQALRGTDRAFDEKVHAIKPHVGQKATAQHLRALLEGSTFVDRTRVQEAYSFRCVPQIHGGICEAKDYALRVVQTEINSVTDNPLVFTHESVDIISGGNFHGEPVAIAMDALGIAIAEIGNTSDRRVAALIDKSTSNGLPPFLIEKGGLNSGLMIMQYTTAALVSENKILAHPASVDSIPTSANVEDLVSMGTISARKARDIFENVANILSIELIAACQAIDLRRRQSNENLQLGKKSCKAYEIVRSIVPYFEEDTEYGAYISKVRPQLPQVAV